MSHIPRKRFGQNFLHDPTIIQRIVASINPLPEQNIIEIGPGLGALTFPILLRCKHMTAIELDRDLIKKLQQEYTPYGDLQLINADALKTDFIQFGQKQRIIGNLPYNISSPLLFHLLGFMDSIQDMHFMLQNEVVNRLVSAPDNKTYGRLSVMIQAYCKVDKLFEVQPTAFSPRPAVDSAIVRMVPEQDARLRPPDHKRFSKVVSLAFAHRRKTLRNNLRSVMDESTMSRLGVCANDRAENLSVEQFIGLASAI